MSGHMRYACAALFIAAFSTPAVSNPLTDLFTPTPAPEAAAPAAPAPAQDSCASRPGAAAPGGHWVYRYDGHRKCWFQAEGGGAVSKRPARVTRRHVATSDDNESEPNKKSVDNARAELVNAPPAETPQPPPAEPKLTIVKTIPVRVADAAEAQVPPPPARDSQAVNQQAADQQAANQQAADQPNPYQPTPVQSAPRHVDVDKLLADAPAASSETAFAAVTPPIADPGAYTGVGEWISPWFGALLIVLGGVALLGASLRRVLWPARSRNSRTDYPHFAYDDSYHPAFGRIAPAGARQDELLHYDSRSVTPLAHAPRARRPEAPQPPSREARWDEEMDALAALAQIRFVGPLPSGLRDG